MNGWLDIGLRVDNHQCNKSPTMTLRVGEGSQSIARYFNIIPT